MTKHDNPRKLAIMLNEKGERVGSRTLSVLLPDLLDCRHLECWKEYVLNSRIGRVGIYTFSRSLPVAGKSLEAIVEATLLDGPAPSHKRVDAFQTLWNQKHCFQ